jgi:hypothetical protein
MPSVDPPAPDAERYVYLMSCDKNVAAGTIRFVLLRARRLIRRHPRAGSRSSSAARN